MESCFNLNCKRCPRITAHLKKISKLHPDYHCRPVPPFGDNSSSLMIVGLGPGMHGANATGRPFTGDYAGILLYRTLYEFGFSNKPESVSVNDRLKLIDCRITNAVKCLPPENKPATSEIINCNMYLANELRQNKKAIVILALGGVAHNAVLRALSFKQSAFKFKHNSRHDIGSGRFMLDSYHCSRYNTQTKRLTEEMFRNVIRHARKLIDEQRKT